MAARRRADAMATANEDLAGDGEPTSGSSALRRRQNTNLLKPTRFLTRAATPAAARQSGARRRRRSDHSGAAKIKKMALPCQRARRDFGALEDDGRDGAEQDSRRRGRRRRLGRAATRHSGSSGPWLRKQAQAQDLGLSLKFKFGI